MYGIYSAYRIISIRKFHQFSNKEFNKDMLLQIKPGIYIKEKLKEMVKLYDEITGMDEVRIMQNRVIEAQDKFIKTQEKRRYVGRQLAEIQAQLKDIHSELDSTNRGEERYLQLVTDEHNVLKKEKKLVSEFALVENDERDSFSTLSAYVKESHERERAQADRTKYFSLIASVFGTMLGVIGSTINNHFKMKQLRNLVYDTLSNSTKSNRSDILLQQQQELTNLINNIKLIKNNYHDSYYEKLKNLFDPIENVSELANLPNQIKELKTILKTFDGEIVVIPDNIKTVILEQQREMRFIGIAVAVMGILVPIIITVFNRS